MDYMHFGFSTCCGRCASSCSTNLDGMACDVWWCVQQLAELVGKNLNQLAGLGGLNFQQYRALVLPEITEQIVHCEDKLAQRFLMEVGPPCTCITFTYGAVRLSSGNAMQHQTQHVCMHPRHIYSVEPQMVHASIFNTQFLLCMQSHHGIPCL